MHIDVSPDQLNGPIKKYQLYILNVSSVLLCLHNLQILRCIKRQRHCSRFAKTIYVVCKATKSPMGGFRLVATSRILKNYMNIGSSVSLFGVPGKSVIKNISDGKKCFKSLPLTHQTIIEHLLTTIKHHLPRNQKKLSIWTLYRLCERFSAEWKIY